MPADDLIHFTVTVPAGTPAAAPLVVPTVFRPSIVEQITWRLPPGTAGLVGFQVGARGVQIIPALAGQFIIGEGTSGSFAVQGKHDTGDWSVIAYNTGTHPHNIYLTYHIRTLRPAPAPFALAHDAAISNYSGQVAIYGG